MPKILVNDYFFKSYRTGENCQYFVRVMQKVDDSGI